MSARENARSSMKLGAAVLEHHTTVQYHSNTRSGPGSHAQGKARTSGQYPEKSAASKALAQGS